MRKWLVFLLAALAIPVFAAGPQSGTTTTTFNVVAHAKPTVALANLGAGLITNGTHSYKITLLDAGGATLPSPASSVLTTATATNGKVLVTIPAFVTGQTGANVYRTVAGNAGNYLLVNATPILAAGGYTDNIADGSLGAAAPASNTTTTPLVDPTGAAVAALANLGAGLCTSGAHLVKVAYVTPAGVSTLSAASDSVTTAAATNGKILVTVVASANASVSSVNAYMTEAGGSDYYLAVSGVANTNGNTTLNIADATLITQTPAPTTDTSGSDTILGNAPSATGWNQVVLYNMDAAVPLYISLDGTQVSTSSDFYIPGSASPQPYTFFGTNGSPITQIRVRSTTAGVSCVWWANAR